MWDARTMHAAITFPRRRHIQLACDIDEEANICVSSSQGCLDDGCTTAVRSHSHIHTFSHSFTRFQFTFRSLTF